MFSLATDTEITQHEGIAALQRLLEVAHRGTGQSCIAARFLLSLYNGERFPFDLTDFRCFDLEIFQDCLMVLIMDNQPKREVHRYFRNGQKIWEQMAVTWSFSDHDSKSWR